MQNQSLCHEDPLEKDGNPLQCSCLENSMDRGACWATVHGVTNNWTPLSDWTGLSPNDFASQLHITMLLFYELKQFFFHAFMNLVIVPVGNGDVTSEALCSLW